MDIKTTMDEHKRSKYYKETKDMEGNIDIHRIQLDNQGYTKNGRYYGTGQNLYCVDVEIKLELVGAFEYFDFYIRANDRQEARNAVKQAYPHMKVAP